MQNYELTVVLPGEVSPAKKKAVVEKVEKTASTLEGKVAKVEEWGKIDLAYKINKETSGIFLHFVLELDGKGAKTITDKLKMEEEIIRYLLIRK